MTYSLADLMTELTTVACDIDYDDIEVSISSGVHDNSKLPTVSLTTTRTREGTNTAVVRHVLTVAPKDKPTNFYR